MPEFIPDQIGYVSTHVAPFRSAEEDFSDEELSLLQSRGQLIYQCSGYDEDGYYQAGFIQGTYDEISGCDIECASILRDLERYRRDFGPDFVASVRPSDHA